MALPITAGTTEIVSLTELKAQLNMSGASSDDGELALVRDAAERLVEGMIGDVLHREHVEVHRATSSGLVTLEHRPVLAVTSVIAGGQELTGYTVNLRAGILRAVHYTRDVTVTYTAGRTEAPADLRLGVLIVAQHLWRTQQGASPMSYDDDVESPYATAGTGFALPSRAEELLRPYALGSAFA